MRVITNVTSRSSYREQQYSQRREGTETPPGSPRGGTWENGGGGRMNNLRMDEDNFSEISASAANVANDGKNPLLEFAMRYFRDGKDKFEQVLSEPENGVPPGGGGDGSLKKKSKAKKKKSGASDADWTWKDSVDIVKWTDRMINVS